MGCAGARAGIEADGGADVGPGSLSGWCCRRDGDWESERRRAIGEQEGWVVALLKCVAEAEESSAVLGEKRVVLERYGEAACGAWHCTCSTGRSLCSDGSPSGPLLTRPKEYECCSWLSP